MADQYLTFWNLSKPLFIKRRKIELFETAGFKESLKKIQKAFTNRQKILALKAPARSGKSYFSLFVHKHLPLADWTVDFSCITEGEQLEGNLFSQEGEPITQLAQLIEDRQQQAETVDKNALIMLELKGEDSLAELKKTLAAFKQNKNQQRVFLLLLLESERSIKQLQEKYKFVDRFLQLQNFQPHEFADFAWQISASSPDVKRALSKDTLTTIFKATGNHIDFSLKLLELCLVYASYTDEKAIDKSTVEAILSSQEPAADDTAV